jgi:hypothetical protein
MGKLWLVIVCLPAGFGCSNKTETGYAPRTLGDSETVQRGYYASPFSPEARQAESERQIEFQNRRPDVYR